MQTSPTLSFTSLPSDILDIIFDKATTLGPKMTLQRSPLDAMDISHICRRFRTLVLQSPKLWTSLSTNLTDDTIAMCLERSKDVSLDVEIDFGILKAASGFRMSPILSNVIFRRTDTFAKMSHRWCGLSIVVPNSSYMPYHEIGRTHELLARLRPPNLRRLSVRSSNFSKASELAEMLPTLQDILSQLQSTCLQELRSAGFLFRHVPSTITKLSITLLHIHTPNHIADLLLSSSLLEEFTLDISSWGSISSTASIKEYTVVRLRTLHLLSVDPMVYSGFPSIICLLKTIRFPNLKTLSVALGPCQTWRPESWPGYKDLHADEIL